MLKKWGNPKKNEKILKKWGTSSKIDVIDPKPVKTEEILKNSLN